MTAPRNWITSELVTASIMNEHLRDMHIALAGSKPIAFSFGDPGGAVLTTGVKMRLYVPNGFRVGGWTLNVEPSGSIVFDLWRATYPTIPTVGETITGTEKPTVVAAVTGQDLTLGSWIPDVADGSNLWFNIDSCTSVKHAVLTLNTSLLAMV